MKHNGDGKQNVVDSNTTKDDTCTLSKYTILSFLICFALTFPICPLPVLRHGSPAAEVFCHCGPAAEEVGPERLELLSQFENGRQRLAMLIQTRVQLLDV